MEKEDKNEGEKNVRLQLNIIQYRIEKVPFNVRIPFILHLMIMKPNTLTDFFISLINAL